MFTSLLLGSRGRSPWSNLGCPLTDNARRTGAAIGRIIRFVVWLVATIETIEKFLKSHKFTIGDRIEITALDVLERERIQHLRGANLGIEKLRRGRAGRAFKPGPSMVGRQAQRFCCAA
jgi:hypothetical protein